MAHLCECLHLLLNLSLKNIGQNCNLGFVRCVLDGLSTRMATVLLVLRPPAQPSIRVFACLESICDACHSLDNCNLCINECYCVCQSYLSASCDIVSASFYTVLTHVLRGATWKQVLFVSRVVIANWYWVSKGPGGHFIRPG